MPKLSSRLAFLTLKVKIIDKIDRIGAGDGIRTRDLQLGKLTLYH